jgi:hypothetical protein
MTQRIHALIEACCLWSSGPESPQLKDAHGPIACGRGGPVGFSRSGGRDFPSLRPDPVGIWNMGWPFCRG